MKTTNELVGNNLLLKYNRAIYNFERYVEDLYRKTDGMKCGYLINLKDYEDLKKKVNYSKDNAKKALIKEIKLSDSEKIYTIKEIGNTTPEYLKDMLNKGNKYIMVDQNFWKVICEKGKEHNRAIWYYISQNNFSVTLNGIALNFNLTKNNIIDKNSYKNSNEKNEGVNKNKNIFENNNKIIQNNKKDPLTQFLEKIIVIHNSQLDIQSQKTQSNFFGKGKGKNEIIDYILISKNYMDKFESHMNFKEINEIINNKVIIPTSNINKKINELKDLVKDKPFIKNLGNIAIQNKLDCNYDLSKKEKGIENSITLYYYDNAQIITKELLDVIKSIDKNFRDNFTKKCHYNDNKFITKINENILNIGHNDDYSTFIPEFIIFSKEAWNITKIIEKLLGEGYNSLVKLMNNDLISFKTADNNLKVEAKLIKIDSISDKLKCIILLYINNKKLLTIEKSKSFEKVFLINKKWLEQYNRQYNQIASLIEKNEEVYKFVENIITHSYSIDYLNNIISKLNKESLNKIDEDIINNEELISFNLNFYIAKLFDKQLYIMKDFIIVNEFIFDFMKSIVDSSISKQNYFFFSHKDGVIIASEMNSQYFILIGNLDNKNNIYNIKYILDFNSKDAFENEKYIISSNSLESYIKTSMVYNNRRNNDYVSPIFNEKNIIVGNCYLYKENLDYSSYTNYSKILSENKSNTMIMNSINIYLNTQRIIKKMKTKNAKTRKYYLINKNFINQIKIDNDYNIILDIIEANNFKEVGNKNKKYILSLIKSLPEEDFNKYTKEISHKIKYEQHMEPDIIQACYCDEINKSIFIFDFDLFEEKIIKLFIDDLSNLKDYYLDCTLIEDKIIINYPDNLNQEKYTSIIGTINSEYDFITEYLLIFKDKNSQINHMKTILSGLSNYLNNLSLVNNSQPIPNNNYEIVGIIAKYDPYFQPEINYDIIDNNLPKNQKKQIMENFKDEYNLDFRTDTPFIKNYFKEPPLIGLQNIGSTYYMNSTLQCLCHIEKFVNFFKYSQQVSNLVHNDKNNLTSSFKLLMENLWPNNYIKGVSEKYYVPHEFKEKISKMNPLFEDSNEYDAKDLVNFIITTLHEELNKANKFNNNNNRDIVLDQRNKQIMFNNFAQTFKAENQSIISDLFFSINYNVIQCWGCNTRIYNYQTYFFLEFPLEEIFKFVKRNNQFNNLNNSINIYDCFEYDRKINPTYGDNTIICNYCKKKCNFIMSTYLATGPEILILSLERGN